MGNIYLFGYQNIGFAQFQEIIAGIQCDHVKNGIE